MKSCPPSPAEPVDLLLVLGLEVARAALVLAAAAVALLLTLAGWRPSALPAAAPVPPAAAAPAAPPLEAVTVAELRQLARAAGHCRLARSGRRDQLLQALAPTVSTLPEALPCA